MRPTQIIRALGPIDLRSVGRDPLLVWLVPYPLLLALVIRWGVPALAERLQDRYELDLVSYYPLLMSFLLELMPMVCGMVIGFLLLDQKDDQTLTALRVTPLRLLDYAAYRLSVLVIAGVLMTMMLFPAAGLVELNPGILLILSLGAAPLGILVALFLGAFASNKVEGFALMKASGVFSVPPMIAYFVSDPWQWAFGLLPTYWPLKTFWMVVEGSPWWIMPWLIGLAYQGLLIVGLAILFQRRMLR